ncbi:MAG TPA: orotidine 5'-phosphate decarboxylase [Anaerolineaceae bacterium]|nr:orotidine 5'-phosphate decarboxylase [Anaerolineaceae bacterium]
MKLQLSLDFGRLDDAIHTLSEIHQSVDVIELGTPLLFLEGLGALTVIKELYPEIDLLADLKIIDGGSYESTLAFEAGADIVTVLGCASEKTIGAAIDTAEKFRKKTVIDLLGVQQVEQKIRQIDKTKADYACLHTAMDDSKEKSVPVEELAIAKTTATRVGIAIAGGINISNIQKILPYQPDIIVIGSGITQQPDKAQAAAEIKKAMNDHQ